MYSIFYYNYSIGVEVNKVFNETIYAINFGAVSMSSRQDDNADA